MSNAKTQLAAGLTKEKARRRLKANAKARRDAAARLTRAYEGFHAAIMEAKRAGLEIKEIARLSDTPRQRIYDTLNDPTRPPRVAESDTYSRRVKGGAR